VFCHFDWINLATGHLLWWRKCVGLPYKFHVIKLKTFYSPDRRFLSRSRLTTLTRHATRISKSYYSDTAQTTNALRPSKWTLQIGLVKPCFRITYWLGYGLDDRKIMLRSPAGTRILSLINISTPALGPTKPPAQWVKVFFPGGYSGRSLKLTNHLYLVLKLRISGRLGSRLRGYHPVAPRPLRYGPVVHRI
jgi:hypothetical protein